MGGQRNQMLTTRDIMVAAAADLLDQGGPAAVTLRDVGRLAGVSHNAPYRHFSDKDSLLAAIAIRELRMRTKEWLRAAMGETDIGAGLHSYVSWALLFPERFRLTYGRWTRPDDELIGAGREAYAAFIEAVTAAQHRADLPPGDPARIGALLLALANGAASLALVGHLSRDGKGGANPADLVSDLLNYLRPQRSLDNNGGRDSGHDLGVVTERL